MIITVCTPLYLLHLIKRFKLQFLSKRKLKLFLLGIIDEATGISAKVRMIHDFSMMFGHFLKTFLKQSLSHCNQPNRPKYSNTKTTRMDRVFIAEQCL